MGHPLVSVVIPTYNRASSLGNAISSVLAQTHQDFEIIVVDDGSKDTTPELMAREYGSEARIRYTRQENGGVSAARNHGLRLCQGKFVAFLDSDDAWLPWKLELQVACLARFPEAVLAWSDMQATDPEGKVLHERYLRKMYRAYEWFPKEGLFSESVPLDELCPHLASVVGPARVYKGQVYAPMIMGNLVHTSTVVARRHVLERVGWFDETMRRGGEDYDFHLRTCQQGPALFLDLPLISYQTGGQDQITEQRNGIHFAQAYLQTVTREVGPNGNTVDLPRWMINTALASAHAWMGEELLDLGRKAEARGQLWRGIRINPWRGRSWLLLLIACLPKWAENGLRRLYRFARRK